MFWIHSFLSIRNLFILLIQIWHIDRRGKLLQCPKLYRLDLNINHCQVFPTAFSFLDSFYLCGDIYR